MGNRLTKKFEFNKTDRNDHIQQICDQIEEKNNREVNEKVNKIMNEKKGLRAMQM